MPDYIVGFGDTVFCGSDSESPSFVMGDSDTSLVITGDTIQAGTWHFAASLTSLTPFLALTWNMMRVDINQRAYCGMFEGTLYGTEAPVKSPAFLFPCEAGSDCTFTPPPPDSLSLSPAIAVYPAGCSCVEFTKDIVIGDTPCPVVECNRAVFVYRVTKVAGFSISFRIDATLIAPPP